MSSKRSQRSSLFSYLGVLLPALLAGGLVAAVAVASGAKRSRPRRTTSLVELREAILGSDKKMIAAALGPPRTAMLAPAATALVRPSRPAYLNSETWYYAFPADRSAMSITFSGEIARAVEYFHLA
jgi:hypothetical protein